MSYETITVANPNYLETLHHEDGSKTYVMVDDDAESPRNWSNVSHMVTRYDHRGTFEATTGETPDDVTSALVTSLGAVDDWTDMGQVLALLRRGKAVTGYTDDESDPDYWEELFDPLDALAVDYTSTRYNTYVAVITRADMEEGWGESPWDDENVRGALKAELETIEQWADGETFGLINVKLDGTEESCWGFLGYDNYADAVDQLTSSPVVIPD